MKMYPLSIVNTIYYNNIMSYIFIDSYLAMNACCSRLHTDYDLELVIGSHYLPASLTVYTYNLVGQLSPP